MRVADAMTTKVVAVRPDTPVKAIAQLLLDHGISAVPVLDERGAALGMISEGDLMPRNESEREQRRDWWLRMLSEGEGLSTEFVQDVETEKRFARDIMIKPAVTITDSADLVAAAELLNEKRIKRLPVVRDGRVVGIISRADLVRAVAHPKEPVPDLNASTEIEFPPLKPVAKREEKHAAAPAADANDGFSAKALRSLVDEFEHQKVEHRSDAQHEQLERRHQEAKKFVAADLAEEQWQHMLSGARAAARKGETEFLLVRFPCEVCTDHGRAVNAPDPNWPETLRGLPAKVFLRWREDLRARGFVLHARVIEFAGGVPSEIGLYLAWG